MRWFDADFSYRFPVVLDGSATAAGPVDATIAISRTAARFWDNIQTDADDVRVCAADGLAGISYDLESLNTTTRTVTIELDGATHHVTNTMTVVWIYHGDADAINDEDGITTSSPLTGHALFSGPGDAPVYSLGSPVGATEPVNRRQKRSTETVHLWFFVGPLGSLDYPYEDRADPPEGPQSLSSSAAVVAGGSGTVTAATSAIRLYQDEAGKVYARVTASGGASVNDYDVTLTVVTTEGRTLNGVVRLTVQD